MPKKHIAKSNTFIVSESKASLEIPNPNQLYQGTNYFN